MTPQGAHKSTHPRTPVGLPVLVRTADDRRLATRGLIATKRAAGSRAMIDGTYRTLGKAVVAERGNCDRNRRNLS